MSTQDYTQPLLFVRKQLMDLHKEFLAHLKQEHDFKIGHLSTPTEWFQVITASPEYSWIGEFNSLVADIDILTEIKPLTVLDASIARAEIHRLLMAGPKEGGTAFTEKYLRILMSGANILLYHHQIKKALEALPTSETTLEVAKMARSQWHETQRQQARQKRN